MGRPDVGFRHRGEQQQEERGQGREPEDQPPAEGGCGKGAHQRGEAEAERRAALCQGTETAAQARRDGLADQRLTGAPGAADADPGDGARHQQGQPAGGERAGGVAGGEGEHGDHLRGAAPPAVGQPAEEQATHAAAADRDAGEPGELQLAEGQVALDRSENEGEQGERIEAEQPAAPGEAEDGEVGAIDAAGLVKGLHGLRAARGCGRLVDGSRAARGEAES